MNKDSERVNIPRRLAAGERRSERANENQSNALAQTAAYALIVGIPVGVAIYAIDSGQHFPPIVNPDIPSWAVPPFGR